MRGAYAGSSSAAPHPHSTLPPTNKKTQKAAQPCQPESYGQTGTNAPIIPTRARAGAKTTAPPAHHHNHTQRPVSSPPTEPASATTVRKVTYVTPSLTSALFRKLPSTGPIRRSKPATKLLTDTLQRLKGPGAIDTRVAEQPQPMPPIISIDKRTTPTTPATITDHAPPTQFPKPA